MKSKFNRNLCLIFSYLTSKTRSLPVNFFADDLHDMISSAFFSHVNLQFSLSERLSRSLNMPECQKGLKLCLNWHFGIMFQWPFSGARISGMWHRDISFSKILERFIRNLYGNLKNNTLKWFRYDRIKMWSMK